MKHVVTVLYEDGAADDRDFALHRLVVRCVHDSVLERSIAADFGELCRDGIRGNPPQQQLEGARGLLARPP